jgi:hypothetical protein
MPGSKAGMHEALTPAVVPYFWRVSIARPVGRGKLRPLAARAPIVTINRLNEIFQELPSR